jgi:hypothetical protein
MTNTHKKEISIAILGLIGVIAAAVISSWDKIFPDPYQITTSYSDYKVTRDIEIELRIFFKKSGIENNIRELESFNMKLLSEKLDQDLEKKYANKKQINLINKVILDGQISTDETINSMISIYKDYFTLSEIQDINKLLSTKTMQIMRNNLVTANKHYFPLNLEINKNNSAKIGEQIQNIQKVTGY